MRGSVVFLVVALLLAYVAVTGRYRCISAALTCLMTGESCDCAGAGAAAAVAAGLPSIPPLPRIGAITPEAQRRLEAIDSGSSAIRYPTISPEAQRRLEGIDRGR